MKAKEGMTVWIVEKRYLYELSAPLSGQAWGPWLFENVFRNKRAASSHVRKLLDSTKQYGMAMKYQITWATI